MPSRVATVYGITGVTGVEANIGVQHRVLFIYFSAIKNKFGKNE